MEFWLLCLWPCLQLRHGSCKRSTSARPKTRLSGRGSKVFLAPKLYVLRMAFRTPKVLDIGPANLSSNPMGGHAIASQSCNFAEWKCLSSGFYELWSAFSLDHGVTTVLVLSCELGNWERGGRMSFERYAYAV